MLSNVFFFLRNYLYFNWICRVGKRKFALTVHSELNCQKWRQEQPVWPTSTELSVKMLQDLDLECRSRSPDRNVLTGSEKQYSVPCEYLVATLQDTFKYGKFLKLDYEVHSSVIPEKIVYVLELSRSINVENQTTNIFQTLSRELWSNVGSSWA